MDWPDAQRLQSKAYCAECPRTTPIIRDTQKEERYTVVCPTDAQHPLSIAKSLFRQLYERWRQGERLFSLEGLLFSNALRGMARKEPDRWDYQEDDTGAIIRIGRDWWPGYKAKEEEMTSQALVEYTPSQLNIIRHELTGDKLTDKEFALFLAVCKRTGLDPFARQIYAVKFLGKNPRMVIITGIDGYRLTAARTEAYAGSDDAEFSPTLLDGKYPEWARVTIYKIVQGQRVGFTKTARWTEFAKNIETDDGAQWKKQPFHMLAKCAEAQALRQGFPMETMELTFSAEPVPLAQEQGRQLNTQTGEIIEGSYTEAQPAAQGHKYMTVCPLHALRWEQQTTEKRGEGRRVWWSHPTDEKDDKRKTIWCNRRTALRTVLTDTLEETSTTLEDFEAWTKEQWGITKAGLSEEQACFAIDHLQENTIAGIGKPQESWEEEENDMQDAVLF